MSQDSSRPEFWDARFRGGATPWDAGRAPGALLAWLDRLQEKQRALIPGCGSGYEVAAFAERGHDVLAIDFSEAAVEAAQRTLGELARRVRQADFFTLREPAFDVIYERAFLCALPRRLWPAWGRRVAELLRPGGVLAGFFYFDDNERGPPFGVSREGLDELLTPGFARQEDSAVELSLPVFQGKERWQAWKRRL